MITYGEYEGQYVKVIRSHPYLGGYYVIFENGHPGFIPYYNEIMIEKKTKEQKKEYEKRIIDLNNNNRRFRYNLIKGNR